MDNITMDDLLPGLLDAQELKTVGPRIARANPLMGLLGEVINPPPLNIGADLDREAAYAAQDRMNQNSLEDEFGFISWGENRDPFLDEEGDMAEGEPYVLIEKMEVYPEYRGKGHGKRLLREALADIKTQKPGMEIKLYPDAYDIDKGGLEQHQLVEFYELMGFEADEDSEIGAMVYVGE